VVLDASPSRFSDDRPVEYEGMGGRGVLPIPLIYKGWVQSVPKRPPLNQPTCEQRSPLGLPRHKRHGGGGTERRAVTSQGGLIMRFPARRSVLWWPSA
jgi:hypothetical protein